MNRSVIAFVGQVVPDTPEYDILGFTRAGNLAQIGFVDGFVHAGLPLDVVLSSQPIAYFPRSQTLVRGSRSVALFPGVAIKLVPLVNVFMLRDALRALYIYGYLFLWSLRHIRKRRLILCYNLSVPPILPLLVLSRMTGTKVIGILYDVVWPEGFTYDFVRHTVYKTLAVMAQWCIPRLDGRIVITDSIARKFAPGRSFLRIDGGVTELVINRLFPLETLEHNDRLTLLFAGGIDEWNHLPLLLQMMRERPDARIRLWLAGNGALVHLVKAAAQADPRIQYFGTLNHSQLFDLYQKADVLLNLRNTKDSTTQYSFPSKLLEILAVGKVVITTPIAHVDETYAPYCFVLKEESPQALFERIQEITALSPEERLAFGQRARDYMLREHTWKRQGEKIRAYLEHEVLGEKIETQRRGEKS